MYGSRVPCLLEKDSRFTAMLAVKNLAGVALRSKSEESIRQEARGSSLAINSKTDLVEVHNRGRLSGGQREDLF